PTELVRDQHSYAVPSEARVSHLSWKAKVDMDQKVISATATWSISAQPNAKAIYFDCKGLTIERIWFNSDSSNIKYELGKEDPILGAKLTVPLTPGVKQINIQYRTSPEAEALQWLNPEQTAGKTLPFLFTQSQAILARTWIPCQDSPGIRFTYQAEVAVPKGYLALMSAVNPQTKQESGLYTFRQTKAIPAYLMALAVGDLVFKPIGPKTGVYAEAVTLDRAVNEFADLDNMLNAAERLYGPYQWNRYDVLVLPPSFPFGGMENPELTFATPTILAGDRSLVSLIAHELAHSWSGNLVTNATWDDFWLNEGFTVYFERRIMEEIEGREYADMLAQLGYEDLQATVKELLETKPEDTHLKLDLTNRNPDEGVSDIAYEKGYLFLCELEKAVGRKKFDAFLRNYFKTFAFQTMTTEAFITELDKTFSREDSTALASIALKSWIYESGLPKGLQIQPSQRFQKVALEVQKTTSGSLPALETTQAWSSHEWQYYLRMLAPSLTAQKMKIIDDKYGITKSENSEILAIWLQLAAKNNYQPAMKKLELFLNEVGRRKFIKPIYEALLANPETRDQAKAIYTSARPNYHSVSTSVLDSLLLK
ncbi:MAG TPA: M1 family metallopeptidase, partial [Luteibaculaceae bacterium]|nr:M1 family metallopeptidase [Luteibaculaceae bacterium]